MIRPQHQRIADALAHLRDPRPLSLESPRELARAQVQQSRQSLVQDVRGTEDFDKTMGGYGSGRRPNGKRKPQVEWSWSLCADSIERPIEAGNEGWVNLTHGVSPYLLEAGYVIRDEGDGLELDLYVSTGGGRVAVAVRLQQTPISYGGVRTYFTCPCCSARVLKLHWPQSGTTGLACRTCHGLVYRSSQERPFDLEKLKDRIYRPDKPLPSAESARRRLAREQAGISRTI